MLSLDLLASLAGLLPVWDAWCPDDGRVAAGLATLTHVVLTGPDLDDLSTAGFYLVGAIKLAQAAGAPAWFGAPDRGGGISRDLDAQLAAHVRGPLTRVERAHLVAVAVWCAVWAHLWCPPCVLSERVPQVQAACAAVITTIVRAAHTGGWTAA